MTAVVVTVTRTWLTEVDPDAYGLPADVSAEDLAERMNEDPDSYEYIPGSHTSEGEIDADYLWRAPESHELSR